MYAPQLVELYITAMDYDPSIKAERVRAWRSEVIRPGFTAIVAEHNSMIIGLAYGFLGSPDTWWDRQLRRGFQSQGGATQQQWDMLHSYFELAEIHVHPQYQGLGVGKALLYELMWNIPAKFVLLSTPEIPDEANRAFGLYRKAGFFDVMRNFYYSGDQRPFAILGAALPLTQPPSRRA